MDDTSLLPSSKSQKLSEIKTFGGGLDIISSLSDNVLHHILFFLSTKDSIRTSILSRRWQYLWTSISNIDLDDMYSPSRKNDNGKMKDQYPMCRSFFSDFVDRVLLLHDASDFKRLRLSFAVHVRPSHLNLWISAAVRHNVQELELSLPVKTSFVLPCCLFTCESLLALNLDMDCILKTPSFIHFSSLKTLVLYFLTFSDDESTQLLFSSCPVLQELALKNCGWKNIKTITISIPTLKRLTVDDECDRDVHSCVVKIYAPNLIYLNFSSKLKVDFHLCDLSSLVDASIDISYRFTLLQDVAPRPINVLAGICNVKFLSISNDTLMSLTHGENLVDRLPIFHNMIDLELNGEFHSHLFGVMMDLLEKSPKLEFLDFDQVCDPDLVREIDLMVERVPSCFKTSLKTFKISCFEGKPAEMHFVRFLLKNAIVLERMMIYWDCNLSVDVEKEEEVNNQLKMFPRGSESCVIELLRYKTFD